MADRTTGQGGASGLHAGWLFKRWLWLTCILGSREVSGHEVRGLMLLLSKVVFSLNSHLHLLICEGDLLVPHSYTHPHNCQALPWEQRSHHQKYYPTQNVTMCVF